MTKSPPTALQQLDARLHEQQREVAYLRVTLDLQAYRIAHQGAEPVSASAFTAAAAPRRLSL